MKKSTLVYILVSLSMLVGVSLLSQSKLKKTKKVALELPSNLQEGDIFFQYNNSPTCNAIKVATHSKFSHCGMLLRQQNDWYIFEAIGPVKYTPLSEWIRQGDEAYFEQLRLKDKSLLDLKKVYRYAAVLENKPYDHLYMWDNNNIYCSELVYKLYQYASVDLCPTKHLKDYYLESPEVQEQLKARYGNQIPYDEEIVAPQDLYISTLLTKVQKAQPNYN